jgi:hypothetical protein
MDTSQFLDLLTNHEATAALGASLTTLILARRTAVARRTILVESKSDDRARAAS